MIVDRIIRYDRLQDELADLFDERGIPFDGLPKAKGGIRNDKRSYKEVMTQEQADVIRKAFAKEISIHGWEY